MIDGARNRGLLLAAVMLIIITGSIKLWAQTGTCGGASVTLPFTDVLSNNIFFCAIAEAYFSGLTNGTSPTTYSPSDPVPREQMAAFITRTMDRSITRSSRRAALGQWWPYLNPAGNRTTDVGTHPQFLASDGANVWVSCEGFVHQIRASDGHRIGSASDSSGTGVIVAGGYVWSTQYQPLLNTTYLWKYNTATDSSSGVGLLGNVPLVGMTFDGINIWMTNFSVGGGVIRFNTSTHAFTTFTTGITTPFDILFDGGNLWVTDFSDNALKRVNTVTGSVAQTISTGINPRSVIFDGTNLWVTNLGSDSVTVARAATGTVLATLTGNGLSHPTGLAFDGERVLVTNPNNDSVSLWKATDLSPIGNFPMPVGSAPVGACSDGVRFWIALFNSNQVVVF